jgi:hypothetical protein
MPGCDIDRFVVRIASDLRARSVRHPHLIPGKSLMQAVAAPSVAMRDPRQIRMCADMTTAIHHGAD